MSSASGGGRGGLQRPTLIYGVLCFNGRKTSKDQKAKAMLLRERHMLVPPNQLGQA